MSKREISEKEVRNMILEAVSMMTTDAVEDVFNGFFEDGMLLTGKKKIAYIDGDKYEITEE